MSDHDHTKRPSSRYDAGRAGQCAAHQEPGKQTRVEGLVQQMSAAPRVDAPSAANPVAPAPAVHAAATQGVAGSSRPLPFGDSIQRLFGRHDIGNIQAHTDASAAAGSRAMGAEAFATGNHVAFASTPDLHTAAHEAAHVVQQRGGVQLKGGIGEAGDPHEQHANQVADRVVSGASAEDLLDRYAMGAGSGTSAVQRQATEGTSTPSQAPTPGTITTTPEHVTESDGLQGGRTPPGASPESATTATSSGRASAGWSVPAVVRVTASDGLRVRRTPDAATSDNVLGGLRSHEEIEALAREGEWLRVTYHGGPAFIHGGFVEVAPVHGDTTAAEAPAVHAQPAPQITAEPPRQASGDHGSGGAGAHSPAPAPRPAPTSAAPLAAEHHDPANEFATASGNSIAKTTPKEAEVLNKIRREPRRVDPRWLATAQHNLGVADATGAFNTETLRAMRERAHNPTLAAAGIMDEAFLVSIAPGTPFHEGTEIGTLAHNQPPTASATSAKDRTAQAMGYASFAAYRGAWGDEPVTFLGNDFRTPAHPYLRARISVAETYLRNRVKSPEGRNLDDVGITKALNWNGMGNASYAHEPGNQMTHQHAMGLAIDIDPGQNPYLFDHSVANADFWVGLFEHLFRHATKLYGGEPLSAATMNQWSQQCSTEELFQRVSASSQSFAQMLALSERARGDESATGEIWRKLAPAGYEGEALKTAVHEVAVADHHFHQQQGRASAKAPTNLTQEMVIALRDVAGLAWGGTEMSSIENGDFMHFDCRLTDFGHAVYEAGRRQHTR
jgi:hypothetical protein